MAWLQLNLGLGRDAGGPAQNARTLFATLAPHPAMQARFFFQRKPPDVRLRVATDDPRACFRALWPVLRELQRAGVVTVLYRSVYEPEDRLFGGTSASAAVHACFVEDTRAWMAVDGSVDAPSPPVLVRALVEDLFAVAIGDRTEIWDAWCGLEAVTEHYGAPADGAAPARVALSALAPPSVVDQAPYVRWLEAHRALGAALRDAERQSRLRAGLRSVLVQVALFTANRHGLDGRVTRALAAGEVLALSPERTLIPPGLPSRPHEG